MTMFNYKGGAHCAPYAALGAKRIQVGCRLGQVI